MNSEIFRRKNTHEKSEVFSIDSGFTNIENQLNTNDTFRNTKIDKKQVSIEEININESVRIENKEILSSDLKSNATNNNLNLNSNLKNNQSSTEQSNMNNFSSNFSFNNNASQMEVKTPDTVVEPEPETKIKMKEFNKPNNPMECKINLNLVPHECSKVINVDDEESILKMHRRMFKSYLKANINICKSGAEFMKMLQSHFHCETCKKAEIICLVDYMMDNEWGNDVVAEAKKKYGTKLNLVF